VSLCHILLTYLCA